jgi:hypothetical protein
VIYGSFSRSEAREGANPNLSAFSTETAKFPLAADKGSGGLWNNRLGSPGKDPLVKADKPFGQWNHFRIIMAGSTGFGCGCAPIVTALVWNPEALRDFMMRFE